MAKISQLLISSPADPLDGTEGFHALQDAGSVGATVEQVADYTATRTGPNEVQLVSEKGDAGGYAALNTHGKVPRAQLPGYTDDVLEYDTIGDFPVTGSGGKLYIALDTGITYFWDGDSYEVSSSVPDSTDTIAEGDVNLYFTMARVLSTLIAGLSTGSPATIADGDTVLEALGQLQAQITALAVAAGDAMVFKGSIDCSANPNYPAADAGHTYRVSVAGKIGGGSGVNVEIGDLLICLVDGTTAGNQAAKGSSWTIEQGNIDGAVIGPSSVTDAAIALFDGTTGKLIKQIADAAFKTRLALVVGDVSGAAPLASPPLTGNPTAPTQTAGDNSTKVATTAYADNPNGKRWELVIALSDETTALTTGLKKTWRQPHKVTLTDIRLGAATAPTGAALIVNVKEAGSTIFSTKPQIDATAKTSVGSGTPFLLSDATLADDAEMTAHIDQIGSTIAGAGATLTLIGVYAA